MKTGDKVVKQNKEHKHAMGKSANSVANKFLAALRGKQVVVVIPDPDPDVLPWCGILVEFDLYSFVIKDSDGREILIFKGPGIVVYSADKYSK